MMYEPFSINYELDVQEKISNFCNQIKTTNSVDQLNAAYEKLIDSAVSEVALEVPNLDTRQTPTIEDETVVKFIPLRNGSASALRFNGGSHPNFRMSTQRVLVDDEHNRLIFTLLIIPNDPEDAKRQFRNMAERITESLEKHLVPAIEAAKVRVRRLAQAAIDRRIGELTEQNEYSRGLEDNEETDDE